MGLEERINQLAQQIYTTQLQNDTRWSELMGRWKKCEALDEEALGEVIAISHKLCTVREILHEVYSEGDDPRLLRVIKKLDKVYSMTVDMVARHMKQGRLFEDG